MNNTTSKKAQTLKISFAALDPYVERPIVSPKETVTHNGERVSWGERDAYPDYLLSLYDNVTDLAAIVNGCVDYAAGDDVIFEPAVGGKVNKAGDSVLDFFRNLWRDLWIYGGFAFQVVRDYNGNIAELYHIDLRFLRTNKDNTVFYYSEDWTSNSAAKKMLIYPAYMKLDWSSLDEEQREKAVSSIVFVKNGSRKVYPVPVYAAAVEACEAERSIDEYHLNAVRNGFVASAVVNFNNGVPDDDTKEEIEESFTEKFSGQSNAGRILFSWNPNKDSATTIEYPKVEDFGDKYNALAKNSRQRIFTAFRANPNLFGIPTDSLGFSSEEYDAAFKLFNRTAIKPAQKLVVETMEQVYGRPVLTVIPFTLDGAGEGSVR